MEDRSAAQSIDEYIAEFPPAIQERLQQVREVIRAGAPDAVETISYAMPTFDLHGHLVHFAAFKGHIGLYPTPTGIERFQEELAPYKGGKGSLRFPLDEPLPLDLIRRMVEFRVLENTAKAAKKRKTPRAVGFDLGETLIEYEGVRPDWQHQYPAALAEIAAACGGSPSQDQLAAAVEVLLSANTRVTARAHELDYRQVFGDVVAALGVPPMGEGGCVTDGDDPVEAATDAFFAVFTRQVRPIAGVFELLEDLDRLGLPVRVLTDVPYGMPRRLVLGDLATAGLSRLAPLTTTSVEVGRRKPAPDGFFALAGQLHVAPKHMWFVGNEHRDVAGAKAAGMTAVLLWRSGEPLPAWGQDLVVSSLDELRARLRETVARPAGRER